MTRNSSIAALRGSMFASFVFLFVLAAGIVAALGQSQAAPAPAGRSTAARIIDRPPAPYTKAARDNGIEGIVRLRITFRADGRVMDVAPLTYLPHGLTNQAINSARQIRFEPRTVNGQPADETTTIDYRFRLYYDDSDTSIRKKVEILSRPRPVLNTEELIRLPERKITVSIFFGADGEASVFQYVSRVPVNLRPKIEAAIGQLKFTPAVHTNGKKTNVIKNIEYTF